MAKTKMRDIVVVLPGITGSVLQKDGKDIWNISWDVVSRVVFDSKSFQNLKIHNDDPDVEDLGDGVKATGLINSFSIPFLAKIDGYDQTCRMITDNFDVIVGDLYKGGKPANFFQFPYDWRRDNRATAKLLKRLLDQRLKEWREYTGNQNAKVILLAHSMGGLVSRYYLEVLEGWQDCKALITFGTPYRGAPGAIESLQNNFKKLNIDLTEILRSLPSVYQLLPRYPAIKIDDQYYRIAESPIDLPHIVKSKAVDALENFHRKIDAAVERHQQDAAYLKSYKIIPIVGTKQGTLQFAEFDKKEQKLNVIKSQAPSWIDAPVGELDGDGTVPYVSAIPIELSNEYRETYIAEQHGALQCNGNILTQIRDRLIGMQQTGLIDVRGPAISPDTARQPAIGLSLEDLYLPDEAVVIQATVFDCENPGGLKAQITSATDSSNTKLVEFQQQSQDSWSLALDDLPVGVYRLTVQPGSLAPQTPKPVHALFEVAEI